MKINGCFNLLYIFSSYIGVNNLGKIIPNAPHETLLVIDATTGQNGISQAKLQDSQRNIKSSR